MVVSGGEWWLGCVTSIWDYQVFIPSALRRMDTHLLSEYRERNSARSPVWTTGVPMVEYGAYFVSPRWVCLPTASSSKAAAATEGIVGFGAVNADDHKELAGKYGVDGFP